MKKIAIVGAGPGGLAAAVTLAAEGFKVTVFESRESVGGRNGRLQLGEFSFDVGPTFFLMPHLLENIFQRAGRRMEDYITLTRLDPMYRLVFPDDTILDPRDSFEAMHEAIAELAPCDADQYPKYYEYMDKKLSAILPILSTPYLKAGDLASMNLLKAFPYLRPDRSLAKELQSFFKDERTQLSFGFQAKYLGMSPYHCPSLFSILNFIEQKYGIWHPIGGLNQITSALAKLATEIGVDIKLGTPVEHVSVDDRRITKITAGGDEYEFDHYVVNADIASFLLNTVDSADRKKYSDEKLEHMKYSCSTYMLYLGLNKEVDLSHHTVVFSRDYKSFLKDISETGELSSDPSFYICNASASDASVAPEGKSGLYILSPVPNLQIGKMDWATASDEYRTTLLTKIKERLGIDLSDSIEIEKRIDPLSWRDDFNVAYGAVFSFQHTLDQLLIFRPRNKFEEFSNVYLVGGGTHPGSGLPTIFQSAQIATDLICKEERP